MKNIKSNHYVDTAIYSIEMIIKNLKFELRKKIDKLGIGITSEQFVVLDTIYYYENMYQEKLSAILMKDKSNMTRIIKILESKKLINRNVNNLNNRLIYRLDITEEGKKIIDENMPKIKKYITELFKNITDEEIDVLYSLSKKFQSDLLQNSERWIEYIRIQFVVKNLLDEKVFYSEEYDNVFRHCKSKHDCVNLVL